MDDDFEVEIEDLAIDEICELLQEQGAEISPEQAQQLAALVTAAGSIESALQLLDELAQERRAA